MAELNPKELERLLERNLTLGTDHKYILSVFEGFVGLVRVRERARDLNVSWNIGSSIDSAKKAMGLVVVEGGPHLSPEKGTPDNWFRRALDASFDALRKLAPYSEPHVVELWEVLRLGLTAKLPIVDAISTLQGEDS